ncbi:MAG: hypothetical protein Q9191_003480 [Dirinaria sp. TL-2023a]
MTLEDFEKSLAGDKKRVEKDRSDREVDRRHRKHHHHHHHHHHKRKYDDGSKSDEPRPKRSRRSHADYPHTSPHEQDKLPGNAHREASDNEEGPANKLKRDSWMESPSALESECIRNSRKAPSESLKPTIQSDSVLRIHEKELNKDHLKDLTEERQTPEGTGEKPAQHEVDYVFGDIGSQWRMTKLKGVYRQAEDAGRAVEDVATDVYGGISLFDDAREEQVELERRDTYGPGYVGKVKPSGELFQERMMEKGLRNKSSPGGNRSLPETTAIPTEIHTKESPPTTFPLDHTALNRLKAQMMKAKLRGSADASRLEAEYAVALASSARIGEADTVVLGTMDNRMLAGGRKGEVKAIDNKRGRERGLVEENEDMTIEDMVREERRARYDARDEGRHFAERIAKDGKFDNNLDYMDENASKLAKRVHKSDINLKNIAISDFQKLNRILDNCPLCHREDTNSPPVAPVVSLATRTYLTLPTEPEISDGGACIVPIQHRVNLLECDDDEWEEIRNFMKSLTRMYHDQGRDVIFYENAAAPQRKKHAALQVVPLPYSLGETAPAFFREAILTTDEEWTQHKKLIDTLAKAKQGLGKAAFRRTLVKEMPYFHVWFQIDGGLGHIVEDSNRWPKGDLFAREIIGGMLDKDPDVIKRQGHWSKAGDSRVHGFRTRWRKFDWTRVLSDT